MGQRRRVPGRGIGASGLRPTDRGGGAEPADRARAWRPLFGELGEWSVLVPPESVEAAERILAEPPPTDAELTALALKDPPPDDFDDESGR